MVFNRLLCQDLLGLRLLIALKISGIPPIASELLMENMSKYKVHQPLPQVTTTLQTKAKTLSGFTRLLRKNIHGFFHLLEIKVKSQSIIYFTYQLRVTPQLFFPIFCLTHFFVIIFKFIIIQRFI
jgi:hypothetical protein